MEQIRTTTNSEQARLRTFDSLDAPRPSFLEALIDPVNVFHAPDEVVEHPWFTDEEKRTILLSWARDELTIEQVASKVMPDLKLKSRIDAVIEALAVFDPPAAGEYLSAVATMHAGAKGRRRGRARTQ